MQTPSTLSIWLSEQAVPLAIIVALLAFVMIVLYFSARARKTKMNEARSGVNEDTFVKSLTIYGFDPEIARTTFRYMQEKQGVSFPSRRPTSWTRIWGSIWRMSMNLFGISSGLRIAFISPA